MDGELAAGSIATFDVFGGNFDRQCYCDRSKQCSIAAGNGGSFEINAELCVEEIGGNCNPPGTQFSAQLICDFEIPEAGTYTVSVDADLELTLARRAPDFGRPGRPNRHFRKCPLSKVPTLKSAWHPSSRRRSPDFSRPGATKSSLP